MTSKSEHIHSHFSISKYTQWYHEIIEDTPIIIDKVAAACDVEGEEVKEVLIEALRYLDLVSFKNEMLTPSLKVDYAWHELILCTRLYARFCNEKFGKFIHHHPGGRTNETISRFRKTIKYYILYIGQPNEKYWGEQATTEWESSQCGSCEPSLTTNI